MQSKASSMEVIQAQQKNLLRAPMMTTTEIRLELILLYQRTNKLFGIKILFYLITEDNHDTIFYENVQAQHVFEIARSIHLLLLF